MKPSWRFALIVTAPGLLSGLIGLAVASLKSFVLDDCDAKFGCADGVLFFAFIASVGFILSAIGLWAGLISQRTFLGKAPSRLVLYLVAFLTALVYVMTSTVGAWPMPTLAATVLLWVGLSAVVGWVATAFLRWTV